MKCVKCGNELEANTKFCASCGTAVEQAKPAVKKRPSRRSLLQNLQQSC